MSFKSRISQSGIASAIRAIGSGCRDVRRGGSFVRSVAGRKKKLGDMDAVSDYDVLKKILKNITLEDSDVFVDIGCGNGRVINYLLTSKYKCRVIGIEKNSELAAVAAETFRKKGRVSVVCADAEVALPPEGTVFYIYCPFEAAQLERVLINIEHSAQDAIKLIYVDDVNSSVVLCRDGWQPDCTDSIPLRYGEPMHYTIYTYMP